MDYRVINAAATALVVLAWVAYIRAGTFSHLRLLVTWLAGWCAYYGIIYSLAAWQAWDTPTVSAWLRPPLAVVFASIAFLIYSLTRWPK